MDLITLICKAGDQHRILDHGRRGRGELGRDEGGGTGRQFTGFEF